MQQYLFRRMVLVAFLMLFVFLASYSQYVRPTTVIPGSTADKIFDNADKIWQEAQKKPSNTIVAPKPVNNTRTNNNSSSIVTNKTEFLPSAEAKKAYDDAKKANDNAKIQFDEKIKMASGSACVCNTSPYAEVKFIGYTSYTPFFQSKYYGINEKSLELFDKAKQLNDATKQLNDAKLLSGFLLNIKGEGKQVVVVESQLRNGSGMAWNPYLIGWDKYNSGKHWSGFQLSIDISGLGNYATLTDKLKYIENSLVKEQDRQVAESKRKNEENKEKYQREQDELIKRNKEIEQTKISNARRMMQEKPYVEFSFENYKGVKLDSKGYPLNSYEKFVAFFAVNETPYTGKVYKFAKSELSEYYNSSYSFLPVMTFDRIVPDKLKTELSNSPFRYKILERLVGENFGYISAAESDKLKEAERKFFKESLPVDEKATFTSGSGDNNTYTGNLIEGKKSGIGIRKETNKIFSGSFIDDKTRNGVESINDGSKMIYFTNPDLSDYPYSFRLKTNGDIELLNQISGSADVILTANDNLINLNLHGLKSISMRGNVEKYQFFSNGDIYHGDIINGAFDNRGVYLEAAGERYSGQFHNGERNGQGVIYDTHYGTKGVYYKNGKQTNKKVEEYYTDAAKYIQKTYPDGKVYLGESDGRGSPIEYGIVKYPNGNLYQGFFSNDQVDFNGVIRAKDGRIIQGSFNMRFDYDGNFKISVKKEGVFYLIKYPDKSFYYGRISDSFEKTGLGVLYYSNGDMYCGYFSYNLRSAEEATMVYKNGDIFIGRFVNDRIEGRGEYLDAVKKEKYVGNFIEGLRDGEGTLYFADGTSKKVVYKDGVLQQ